jgi:hypothetical protein
MSIDPEFPGNPHIKSREQVIAAFYEEMERLRGLNIDAQKVDEPGELPPPSYELTAEDIANSVPARPIIEAMIKRLEQQ